MKLLKLRMLTRLGIFLTLETLISCSSKPIETKFDAHWQFVDVTPYEEPMICLNKADLIKLKEILVRCEVKEVK